jgi:hypothetical protein
VTWTDDLIQMFGDNDRARRYVRREMGKVNNVAVYADATARDAALPSPADGMVAGQEDHILAMYVNSEWEHAKVFYVGCGVDNTGDNQVAAGEEAGNNNSGDYTNSFGHKAGKDASGDYRNDLGGFAGLGCTGSNVNNNGYFSGSVNTGDHVNNIGRYAGFRNSGSDVNNNGAYSGRENSGSDVNNNGHYSGRENTGSDVNFNGRLCGDGNDACHVNAFGRNAFQHFDDDTANATPTFDDADIDGNVITVNHDLELLEEKAVGDFIHLRLDQGTGALGDLTDGDIYRFEITSETQLTCQTDIGTVGTETGHKLVPRYLYHRSDAFGPGAEPDAADQAMFGTSGDPKQIKTYGAVTIASDDTKLTVGAADDAGMWYDGTNLHIDAALVGSGTVILDNLPTSDPSVAGGLWSDGGTLKVSSG